MNRYAYVEGNPITKVDPSGYSSQPGSVGAILNSVGYKNRVLTVEFAKETMSSLDRPENWCVWGKLLYR